MNAQDRISNAITIFAAANNIAAPPLRICEMPDQFGNFQHGRGTTAVYFLIAGDNIIYIGITDWLRPRCRTHKNKMNFDRVVYAVCENEVFGRCLEFSAIQTLTPELNTMLTRKGSKHTIYNSLQSAYMRHGMT